uniref:Uncharacterized protein ALNC14_079890 n=1 Tax=Albugo laibachii Nc14 TaxID=890382 RepID=F0W6J9_9STRA|nr:hypothetical protein PITG_08302 [Albugo laibachii Nc14]CCA21846.1 unnamed protein product [Albugo laibachii Nc14]|eukprot:CCA21846.1 unnamed protein product [Albugo laibachii Nc14]
MTSFHIRPIYQDKSLLDALRNLNRGILPIQCPNSVYKVAMGDPRKLSAVVRNTETCGIVGGLIAQSVSNNVVIHTLAIEIQYRRRGVGTLLLKYLESLVINEGIECMQLYVHEDNDVAILFYQKFGFHKAQHIPDCYRHLKSPGGFLLEKRLERSSRLGYDRN